MARMIPAVIDPECKSPGEHEIYRRLRDDPGTKDWIVLHSLDIAVHQRQIQGEADFIIVIPGKGILCMEVKAHRQIVRDDKGLWYFGQKTVPDPKGPFKQASEAMHSLRSILIKRRPDLSRVVFWSGVIFPYTRFAKQSPEWHDWQIIDNRSFWSQPISRLLTNIIENARLHLANCITANWFFPQSKEPYPDQCEDIIGVLRPSFEFGSNFQVEAKHIENELKIYTEEQFQALDAMDHYARAIFQGPAGTGKTFLALEAVRRSASTGRRVLLLSFNALLGKWLSEQVKHFNGAVVSSTIHAYMKKLANDDEIHDADSSYWENELPQKAVEALLGQSEEIRLFDEIIVDEMQDILRPDYLDVLDLSLKGGLAAGCWRFFGDFEKQAIYDAAVLGLEQFTKDRVGFVPVYSLRVNCRNTPRIAAMACMLGSLNPKYTRIRRDDDGIDARTLTYETPDDQKDKLVTVLEQLYKDGFRGGDIVILSPFSENPCADRIKLEPWKSRIKRMEKGQSADLKYCSIHYFKGMEAAAVIVTDITLLQSQQMQSLLYIATTRALHRLYLLINKDAKEEYASLILKGLKL